MVDESVVAAIREYLRVVRDNGFEVSFAVVFGSQAQGRADKWSDIDLLVVSPHFDGPRTRQDVETLWLLAARVDNRIEPIPCGLQQWQEDQSSAIVEIARREGERVEPQLTPH